MVKYFSIFLSVLIFACFQNAYSQDIKQYYPISIPPKQQWSFSGPFGFYDQAQLQRGLQVYTEVCASCHGLKYVAYRDLSALGYPMEDIKAYAAQYEVEDGPNLMGEIYTRKAQPSDYFKSPFKNEQAALFANNGALPVDLSLIAKAREVREPNLNFITDIFTNYTAAGPDYITALLLGYQEPKALVDIPDGLYYNPYFISGNMLAMAPPLQDNIITYKDGTPTTVENYAKDVSAFLMWSADPHMEVRKKTGFAVILFLIVLAILSYALKRCIWNEVDKETL